MSKIKKMQAALEEWNLEHDADARALLGDIRWSAAKEEAARAGGCCCPAEDHRHTVTARKRARFYAAAAAAEGLQRTGVRGEEGGERADCSELQ